MSGSAGAWSRTGEGWPLVRVGVFMTHIEYETTNQVWGRWLNDLGRRCTYIRFDERGCGLSERNPASIGEQVWLDDLDAVVRASGFDQVALFGMSAGAALAIAYATARPERVSHLVLLGGYAAGGMAPASSDEMDALHEMQRVSASGEMAGKILLNRDVMDVRHAAQSLDVLTLVAHARDDHLVAYTNGIELAALIPGATLLTLDSRNHLLLGEPAWDKFVRAVDEFLGADPTSTRSSLSAPDASDRELEVLEHVAQGSSNEEISEQLNLSVRTIERHLANLYTKLGLSGKSARAGAVGRLDELRRTNQTNHSSPNP